MRVSKYIVSFIGALIMSCSNFTDIQPDHALTPNNAFKTMGDIELHLNGIYSGFQSTGYFALAYGTLPDMMSDNLAENVESLGNYRSTVDWLYVSNDGTISGIWATPYSLINNCNILLSNVDKFKETKTGQANRLKSQALAIRALAHFDLLRFFGQSYDRNSTLLGVPIKTVSDLDKPTRNTVKEVYDQIYADLAQAKTLMASMDQSINSSTDRSRIDVIGVDAIMARVAYYAKDYASAISSASSAINNAQQLALAARADFPSIWTDGILDEVIWYIKFFPGDGYVAGDVYFAVNDRVSFKPSQNLLSIYTTSFSTTTTDIRYSSYFSSTVPKRVGQLIVSKYLGPNGDGLTNWKALRMGEMYLIRSEALARSNQATAAQADLNALRAARISPYAAQTYGATLLTEILLERRRELFLEGHRWFDLRIAAQGITRGGDCSAPATVCSLAANSFRFVWPIPQDEIIANANIASQQNTGY